MSFPTVVTLDKTTVSGTLFTVFAEILGKASKGCESFYFFSHGKHSLSQKRKKPLMSE